MRRNPPAPRASRRDRDLTRLEDHLSRARYFAEVAVVVSRSGDLVAVGVPDETALRAGGLVDLRGTVDFELRRRASELPHGDRPVEFHVVIGPLPRREDGAPHRDVIRERLERGVDSWEPGLRTARHPRAEPLQRHRPQDEVEEAVLASLAAAASSGAPPPRPEHHLALDLGLDSLDRVALLADVESRLDRSLPDAAARSATAAELVAAARRAPPGRPTTLMERIVAAPGGPEARRTDALSRRARLLRPVRAPLVWLLRLLQRLALDLEVVGSGHVPQRGPSILCPNHLSVLDPFFMSVLPRRYTERLWNFGATWIFETRLRWPALYLGRTLPVDNRLGEFLPALRRAARVLERGERLTIFPEGMRCYAGRPAAFRPGAAILAARYDVPLVPVALAGIQHVLPLGGDRPRFRDAAGRKIRIRVEFGQPIEDHRPAPGEDALQAARRVTAQLRRRVVDLLAAFPEDMVPWNHDP